MERRQSAQHPAPAAGLLNTKMLGLAVASSVGVAVAAASPAGAAPCTVCTPHVYCNNVYLYANESCGHSPNYSRAWTQAHTATNHVRGSVCIQAHYNNQGRYGNYHCGYNGNQVVSHFSNNGTISGVFGRCWNGGSTNGKSTCTVFGET